jgi:hypothetical protein
MSRRFAGLLLLLVCPLLSLAAADDPLIGTWQLNTAKSSFSPGPTPQSATVKFEVAGDGVKQTVTNTSAAGTTVTFSMTYKFDGKDYPVAGDASRDTVSWSRPDPFTLIGNSKKGDKVTITQRRVLSADGKTFTTITTGTNARSQSVNNTEFFEKEGGRNR